MKKTARILGILIVLCMLFTVASYASTGQHNQKITYRGIGIVVNGTEIAPCDVNGNSTEPFILNSDGSTYLPVRAVAGALGLDVGWNDSTNTVILKSGGAVKTGSGKAVKSDKVIIAALYYRDIVITLDGKAVQLKNAQGNAVEPFIKDGTTYIPVRAVATALGCEVGWNGDTNTVTITKGGSTEPTPAEDPTPAVEPLKVVKYNNNVSVGIGEVAQYSVTVSGGTAPYTYKWEYSYDGQWYDITSTLSLFKVNGNKLEQTVKSKELARDVRCTITDAAGEKVTTGTMTCTVLVKDLSITAHPQDQTVNIYDNAYVNVEAAGGTEPYTYQWQYKYYDKDEFKDFIDTENPAFGSHQSEYMRVWTDTYFRCIVTDATGKSVTSNVATCKVISDEPVAEFRIMTQPVGRVVEKMGDKVTLSVEVVGGKAPYTYQWQYKYSSADVFSDFSRSGDSAFGKDSSESVSIYRDSLYRCLITDCTGKTLTSNAVACWVRQ